MARPTEIAGLSGGQPFAEAAAAVIEARAAQLLTHSDRVLDVEDIEGVHATRVATRRLRAALEVFAVCFPKRPYKRLLKQVKQLADALGERRDRDVAIAELLEFAAAIGEADRPGVDSLIERLRTEQQQANEDLTPFVGPGRLDRLEAAALELAGQARERAR